MLASQYATSELRAICVLIVHGHCIACMLIVHGHCIASRSLSRSAAHERERERARERALTF